ncbi:MAG: hypothetical protein JWO59_721 [Chloroflexi bacterium]|nr:hypothetical protein [Chloroflexota bacterium]
MQDRPDTGVAYEDFAFAPTHPSLLGPGTIPDNRPRASAEAIDTMAGVTMMQPNRYIKPPKKKAKRATR